jgi:MYXO-CTERM domain-containing protein
MKIVAIALPAVVAATAAADSGVTQSTGLFQWGASGGSAISAIGSPADPRLDGFAFGAIDASAGQGLFLNGWQFTNFANGADFLDQFHYAKLIVTVKSGGSVVSTADYALVQVGSSGDSVSWSLVASAQGTNLAASLADGDYTVEFKNNYNFNRFVGLSISNIVQDTAVSTATFSVVPAPGAVALLAVAGLAASRRRN